MNSLGDMNETSARFYELMLVVDPTSSEASDVIAKFSRMVEDGEGTISRFEDCKTRTLAYRINKLRQGHYFLLNFSCTKQETINELQHALKVDPHVLRSLLTRTDEQVSGPSPLAEKDPSQGQASA